MEMNTTNHQGPEEATMNHTTLAKHTDVKDAVIAEMIGTGWLDIHLTEIWTLGPDGTPSAALIASVRRGACK